MRLNIFSQTRLQGVMPAYCARLLGLVWLCLSLPLAHAEDQGTPEGFATWLSALQQEALAQQIDAQAVTATLKDVHYLPKVIELDRKQPEFVSSFSAYINRRITPKVVTQGKQMAQDYQGVLYVAEEFYRVPQEVLLAFWGLETHFGSFTGDIPLASALATLAFEGRRAAFFKSELLNLMRVVAREHAVDAPIVGSWAGATGQMQFMPSTLLKYGVDADADGHIDIWQSLPDSLQSAANYLAQAGWQAGQPASLAVTLPPDFDYSQAQWQRNKPVAEWLQAGVQGVPALWHGLPHAAIVLPQGYDGPAYMVFPNFDVIMQWNRSLHYALAVSLLSQQLRQERFTLVMPTEPPALSFQQMWQLQETLNALGFECGQPDGFPGPRTQSAIRRYQASVGLPQDGYAGMALFNRLAQLAVPSPVQAGAAPTSAP